MHTVLRRKNWLTAIYLILYATAISLWFIDDRFPGHGLAQIENAIYILLMIAWAYAIHTRLIQRGLKRYLIAMTSMLTLWFVFRSLKYFFIPPNTDAARYLWYLYYLPMMFYPVFAIMATVFVGKRNDYVLPKWSKLLYLVSSGLLLMVLTNDLHQWVFVFPKDAAIYTDAHYSYGYGFLFVFGWFLIAIIVVFFCLFYKSRLPEKGKRIAGPMIMPVLGVLYNIAYMTGHASFFPDLTSSMSLLTIASFEIMIRVGLIRSNFNYPELLKASALPTQIMDQKGTVVYASDTAPVLDAAVLSEAMQEGSVIEKGERISVYPIKYGCAVWNEDISQLLEANEELEDVASELEEQYSVSQEVYQTTRRRQMLIEKNRLYNIMQNDTADKVQALSELTDRIEHSTDEEEIRRLTGEAAVLVAYIKRRNNLLFIHEGNDLIDSSDLIYCIRESLKSMELLGITTDAALTLSSPMTFENATRLYDLFEAAIETAMYSASELFVTLPDSAPTISLRMNLVCTAPLNVLTDIGFRVSNEDENEWVLRYDMKNGGEGYE